MKYYWFLNKYFKLAWVVSSCGGKKITSSIFYTPAMGRKHYPTAWTRATRENKKYVLWSQVHQKLIGTPRRKLTSNSCFGHTVPITIHWNSQGSYHQLCSGFTPSANKMVRLLLEVLEVHLFCLWLMILCGEITQQVPFRWSAPCCYLCVQAQGSMWALAGCRGWWP